ncbi:MAG: tetratricopeptide repeat protein [Armatimonadetes bacterium]|nr:tetratricopeptide repeat protein [Armatimonadota bacterium]
MAAVEVCSGLTHYFDIRGAWREGRGWLERAAEALPQAEEDVRRLAGLRQGWFSLLLGDTGAAASLTGERVNACRRSGDVEGLCLALYQSSIVARAQSRLEQSQAELEAATQLARDQALVSLLPAMLHGLARHAGEHDDPQRAMDLLDEAVRIEGAHGSRRGLANIVNRRAEVAAEMGDLDEARRLHEQAHALYAEVGDRLSLASYGLAFGELAWRQGDAAEAARQFQAALAGLLELGHLRGVASAHRALARVAKATADTRAARLHLAECLRINQQLGDRAALAAALEALAAVEAEEDPAAAVRALASASRLGAAADPTLLEELRTRLGEEACDAAWSAGWESADCYDPAAGAD